MSHFIFFISLLFFLVGISGLIHGIRLIGFGVRVNGKIVEITEEQRFDETTIHPIVEFMHEGKATRFAMTSRNKDAYKLNESVTVIFPTGRPEQAKEYDMMVLLGFAILVLAASGYGLYYSINEIWLKA